MKTSGGRRKKTTRRRKDSSSFLARVQPRKTMDFSLLQPTQLPFPLYKHAILFWLCRDSQMAYHVCKSRIEIHCWSWINPSLLKKYLACYLLQVNSDSTLLSNVFLSIFFSFPLYFIAAACAFKKEKIRSKKSGNRTKNFLVILSNSISSLLQKTSLVIWWNLILQMQEEIV